jgi:uncharacterized protein
LLNFASIFGIKAVLILDIANLSAGHYEETWQAAAADLDLQDRSEFQSPISMVLHLDKTPDELIVVVDWKTVISHNCDRCAEPLQTPLEDSLSIVFTRNPQEREEEDDEVLLISESTREVDLADPVRQSLILALPAKQLCQEGCLGLCVHCGANLNSEKCTCPPESPDPRWDKLSQLFKSEK